MTFSPFPLPETERLLLGQLRNSDTADVFVMRSDPDVIQYIPRPLAVTHAHAAAMIEMMNDFIENGEKIN